MVPENSMQAAKGRKQLIVLPNYNIYKPQQDNHKGEVIGIDMLVITNGCLLRLKVHSKERKSCLILEAWLIKY